MEPTETINPNIETQTSNTLVTKSDKGKRNIIVAAILLILLIAVFVGGMLLGSSNLFKQGKDGDQNNQQQVDDNNDNSADEDDNGSENETPAPVSLANFKEGDTLTNEFVLKGNAPGGWFFEGTFEIYVKDDFGKTIGNGVAVATGEAMTEDAVNFEATIYFMKTQDSAAGKLILAKQNASGLPENDESYELDVKLADTPIYSNTITPFGTLKKGGSLTGKADGSWFFEASFTVEIRDAADKLITTLVAQAVGDWMTTEKVDFKTTLNFNTTESLGKLIFKASNPSGLPENDKSYVIPVYFEN